MVHTFPHPNRSAPPAVTALTQSPAVDVIGVGHGDGSIRLVDIRLGEEIMKLKIDDGAVTGLAFRMGMLSTSGSIAD